MVTRCDASERLHLLLRRSRRSILSIYCRTIRIDHRACPSDGNVVWCAAVRRVREVQMGVQRIYERSPKRFAPICWTTALRDVRSPLFCILCVCSPGSPNWYYIIPHTYQRRADDGQKRCGQATSLLNECPPDILLRNLRNGIRPLPIVRAARIDPVVLVASAICASPQLFHARENRPIVLRPPAKRDNVIPAALCLTNPPIFYARLHPRSH